MHKDIKIRTRLNLYLTLNNNWTFKKQKDAINILSTERRK